jgi:hypothetical protein
MKVIQETRRVYQIRYLRFWPTDELSEDEIQNWRIAIFKIYIVCTLIEYKNCIVTMLSDIPKNKKGFIGTLKIKT